LHKALISLLLRLLLRAARNVQGNRNRLLLRLASLHLSLDVLADGLLAVAFLEGHQYCSSSG